MPEPRAHEPAFVITEHDHVQGEAAAPVTLVEYGDFECPYPHAVLAAEAAEAAAAQEKFWALYATMFAHHWELEYRHLMNYARQLGLDTAQFGEALNTHRYLDRVRADVATGRERGVTGPPTFFVNGHRQDGADDLRALAVAIRNVLRSEARV